MWIIGTISDGRIPSPRTITAKRKALTLVTLASGAFTHRRWSLTDTSNSSAATNVIPSRTWDAVRSLFSRNRTIPITGELKYQACDNTICYPPTSVPLRWELQVLPLDLKRSPEAIQHK